MRKGLAVALWLIAMGAVTVAHADYNGADPYEEYGQHVHNAGNVAAVTSGVFGDSVNLYNGSTSFSVVDFSIPGNNALPVELRRKLDIVDIRQTGHTGGTLHGFGDWDIDVPYVYGTFTQSDGWTLYPSGGTNRCTDTTDFPYTYDGGLRPPIGQVWNGNHLHIPGAGEQELLVNNQSKSPAYGSRGTYPWVTAGNWKVSCIANVKNNGNGVTGEGFVAVSPGGVSYTFDWAITRQSSPVEFMYTSGNYNGHASAARNNVFLLATHVQDRFGNWVNYTYGGPNNDQLTNISSSDGRSITLTWSGNTVVSASSALGTWTYGYATASWPNSPDGVPASDSWSYLSTVTRPDGSRWTYTINSGDLLTQKNAWPDDTPHQPSDCQAQMEPQANSGGLNYTIGAPSGATATYNFVYDRLYRDYVPLSCPGDTSPNGTDNYPADLTAYFDNFQLVSKTVSGPALPTQTWSYQYRPGSYPGDMYFLSTQRYFAGSTVQPFIPPGDCSTCALSNIVTVTGPTTITKYEFGRQYARNEGQLLSTEVDDLSGNMIKKTIYVYVSDDDAPNEAFADIAGSHLLDSYKDPMGYRNRPVVSTQIAQDGATFTTSANSFDAFTRTTSETASSSLGYSKTDTAVFSDDLNLWVLGLTTSTSVNGITASQADYDSLDRPIHSYAFGKLVSTKAWNTDGTLASITDGNNHTTSLGNWYRGIPQAVQFADSTTQSATVNDAGRITSVTDENGYATSYGYDAMGRLSSIAYPANDSVNWNATTLLFQQVGGTEFGIPAGHWRQTITTGNATSITYFDAFWRPLVTEHYDASNVSGTLSQSVKRYDAGGRAIFASYPINNLSDYSSTSLTGTHTSYDALDRITEVDQDSELGTLRATTAYLSGFQTQVSDPNGNVRTTSYMAYGVPSTSAPVSIVAPAGETTTINRDVFGKPLSITRSGSYNGSALTVTRYYVYDANQQLCKRIDPESGATVMDYDAAGNVVWSASGLNLPNTATCDTTAASGSGRRVDRGYDARNRVTSIVYPDGFSNTSYAYTPDGLVATEQVDNSGSPVATTYTYDNRRLLTGESLSIPGTSPLTLGYSYDANGSLAAVTYPDGRNITYLPNALGQPTQAGAYATAASYYPNGALKQFTLGNGLVHTMAQDERQLPDRSTDSYAGTAVLDDGRDYDPNGNVAAITDYLPGNVGNRTMTYDGLDRLTQAVSPMFGGDNTAAFSYDPLDNLRSARVGNYNDANYQYDATNRLTSLTDPVSGSSMVAYGYDVQGNLTARNNQTFQFDEANRLRGVPGVETYLYDAGGRRVQKTQTSGNTIIDADYNKAGMLMYRGVPSAMNVTDYIYLGGSLVARVANSTSQVIGDIDGAPTADNASIGGWACSTGLSQSINVELYVGGAPSNGGTHLGTYAANLASEPAVASSCQTSGAAYRFSIALDTNTRAQYAGQAIYIDGDSPVGNNNNQLDHSGAYTVPANPTPPDAPASVNVPSSSATGAITVSWSASANTTNYVLQQSFNGGAWTQVYSGASTSYALSGLGNGNYQYQVDACNAVGCSAFTGSGTLKVAIIPAPPASINAPATDSAKSFTVSWSTSANASSYVLQQSANGGAWAQVYSGGGTSATVTVSASGSYQYRVSACGAGGCGSYTTSNAVAVTLPPASAPSLSSSTSTSTNGTYSLSWTAVSGATRYQLNQSLNGGAWTAVYNSTGSSWTSSGLGSGTYAYVVYACDAGGCSPASNQVTVAVHRIPDPPTVTAPAVATANKTFVVSWTASTEATSYTLQQTEFGSRNAVKALYSGSGTSTGVTLSGVVGDDFQYAVQACNANGCSAWANASDSTYLQNASGTSAVPASGSSQ